MYKPKEHDNIKDIPSGNYEGYLWNCQEKEPEVFWGEKFLDFKEWKDFPFVIEGFLYEEKNGIERSIFIRYTDEYTIYEFDLNEISKSGGVLEQYEYIPHRLGPPKVIKKVKFKQLWLPEKDPLCKDMPVLKLKTHLFTGFVKSAKT